MTRPLEYDAAYEAAELAADRRQEARDEDAARIRAARKAGQLIPATTWNDDSR